MTKLFSRILLLIIIIALIIGFNSWLKQPKRQVPGANEQYYKIVSLPIPDTLSFAGEMVPLDIFYVREALDRELSVNTYWHSSTLQLIKKSHRWFPMIDSILKIKGVPADFKYLSVIESGLSNVVSPAGAAGFWQFMKSTAKEYGLEVNSEVDERYNIGKSTEAACDYLLKSHQDYGSWALVAASYNAGNNGINKQLVMQKSSSYYDLLLNEETSRYVYRILAFKLIFENPESYGFYINPDEYYKPIPTRIITVKNKIESWTDFAKEQGISYKLLKYFNPWLRDDKLKNRNRKTYYIQIPETPYNITHQDLLTKLKQESIDK